MRGKKYKWRSEMIYLSVNIRIFYTEFIVEKLFVYGPCTRRSALLKRTYGLTPVIGWFKLQHAAAS